MKLFSERYGYTKPSDLIIREKITPEIQNAMLSCFDRLYKRMIDDPYISEYYRKMEMYLWTNFLNKRASELKEYQSVATKYIENPINLWYNKLNIVEFCIKKLYHFAESKKSNKLAVFVDIFVGELCREFKRLNFAYRIVNKEVVEVTSEEEIVTIEKALSSSKNNIRTHLNKALELYALKPTGDYRNSIKESISAVEAYCREKTSEDTLGKALNHLESNGIIIPKLLKTAFDKLYAYTNQPDTGIRHALMDDEGSYVPQAEEALFMLVSCSAFINYLNKKVK